MSLYPSYTDDELRAIANLPKSEYDQDYPHRGDRVHASMRYLMRRDGVFDQYVDPEYRHDRAVPSPRVQYVDKKVGEFNWREANKHIKGMQDLKHKASWSQAFAEIKIDTEDPICVLFLSDTHIGDWASNHELLEKMTDEILSTPNLYVALLGDLAQTAIKLRSVSEVTSNMLPPDLQLAYIDSWLDEIADRVLFATWDNHSVDREESQTGISSFAKIQSRRFVYHSGIGHPNVKVGDETYRFAVSHRFLGRSIENPCHAPMRYLRREGHDREIAVMGDYHVPGIMKFTHGATTKVAVNTGSYQTNSGYAARWFSLFTHPIMPCVVLYPDHHEITPLWSVAEWKAIQDHGAEVAFREDVA